jgi:hypothetical protein
MGDGSVVSATIAGVDDERVTGLTGGNVGVGDAHVT